MKGHANSGRANRESAKQDRLGLGKVDTSLSVDEVAREAERIAAGGPTRDKLRALAAPAPYLHIESLIAGYGAMEILHGIDLYVGQGQSLCLIGPNGAGKSTVLHSIYGFTQISGGHIVLDKDEVTHLRPKDKLRDAGIAYILQDNSVFPDMTVEENLNMGGYLLADRQAARQATEAVLDKYPRLKERRSQRAGVLSGGERRLLEISRALIMQPEILLVDEPSIGLEPKYIDMVFGILDDLQHGDGKTIVLVEQNAARGLAYADIGYVLVDGLVAMAGRGDELLGNPDVERLFLGG